jgi:hypothetical protein
MQEFGNEVFRELHIDWFLVPIRTNVVHSRCREIATHSSSSAKDSRMTVNSDVNGLREALPTIRELGDEKNVSPDLSVSRDEPQSIFTDCYVGIRRLHLIL